MSSGYYDTEVVFKKWLGLNRDQMVPRAFNGLRAELIYAFDDAIERVRHDTIDECTRTLGGSYGAAAAKDLQSLKRKK